MTDNKHSGIIKLVLGVGAIVTAGGLGYYFVSQETGAPGGSCSTKGTPCNTAITPYQTAFQVCANKYAIQMQNIINANKATGTGITPTQQQILNQLTQCMNYNAGQIAKVAKQYEPTSVLSILSSSIGEGVIIAATLIGSAAIVSALLKGRLLYSGNAASRVLGNADIITNMNNNNITPQEASEFSNDISSTQSTVTSDSQQFMNDLAEEDVISAEEATVVAEEEASIILETDATTEDSLAGAFE